MSHERMGITRVLTDRELREGFRDIEHLTLVDMLTTLFEEAEKRGHTLDYDTLRFHTWQDDYMPHTTSYRLTGDTK